MPMKQLSIITEPFARVVVDIVRHFSPQTSEVLFSEYDDMPVTPDGRVGTENAQNFPEVNSNLTTAEKCDLQCALSEYEDVVPKVPGCTQSIKHDIELCSIESIKAKLYPVPLHLKPSFEQEVEELLTQGIIRPSTSPHYSPVLMVKKSSESYRLAMDFRMLNSITVFDAEPINTITEELHKIYGSCFLL